MLEFPTTPLGVPPSIVGGNSLLQEELAINEIFRDLRGDPDIADKSARYHAAVEKLRERGLGLEAYDILCGEGRIPAVFSYEPTTGRLRQVNGAALKPNGQEGEEQIISAVIFNSMGDILNIGAKTPAAPRPRETPELQ